MKRYQITGCQIIYADGSRDNVKLQQPVVTGDVEAERKRIQREKNAVHVNLSYTETTIKQD